MRHRMFVYGDDDLFINIHSLIADRFVCDKLITHASQLDFHVNSGMYVNTCSRLGTNLIFAIDGSASDTYKWDDISE